MANPKVQVLIEALDKNFDKVIGKVEKLDDSLEKVGGKGLGTGFATDLASTFSMLERGAQIAQQAWNATVGELVKYGDQVKQLSTITGQSAEQTSRQIQLADDLRVSYQSLSVALRTASKQGIDTSIEGLIALGEQYKKLEPGMQRTEFLMKNFGRQGVEMGKILEKTSDQIRQLAADTPDGLILNDDDIKTLEEYNRALDETGDAFNSLKMQIGKELLPVMNDFLIGLMHQGELWKERARLMQDGMSLTDANKQAIINVREALYGEADALGDASDGMDEAADSTQALEDAQKQAEQTAKMMSGVYRDIGKAAQDIVKSNREYAEDLDNLTKTEADIAQKRKDIEFDLYEFRQDMDKKMAEAKGAKERAELADKLADKENDYYQQLQQNEQDLKDLDEKRLDVDRQKIEADAQKKYNLLEQRALIDGIISSGENEWLLEQAVNLGLITPAARDAAIAQSQWADAMYASFAKTQPGMETTLDLMQRMAAYDGTMVNFGVNFQSNSPGASTGYAATGTTIGGGTSTSASRAAEFMSNLLNNNAGWRDSGGSGMAGQPYMIGTGAQPEMFIPQTNGTFVPNADRMMGTTYNIVINNPKREAAENSIRTSLKKLSYTGVVQ